MVNCSRFYRALESASIAQLYLPLLPCTHARSESIKADSLNSNFLQLGRMSVGRPQRTVYPRRLLSTVKHTEPTTFQLLVRRATSSATETILMKTSIQLSRCCWVRQTNFRATEQSEKFHVRRRIHWSSVSVSQRSASQVLQENVHCAQQLTEGHSMHALFSVCSLRDDNVITSKPILKPILKYVNSILVFWIFLPNIIKIDPCNFELYRFKFGSFLRQCIYYNYIQCLGI